jgi:hypothetical protein
MCNSDALKNPLKATFGGSPRQHLMGAIAKATPIGLPHPGQLLAKKAAKFKKPDKTHGHFGAYTNAFDQKTALGG